MAYTKRIGKNSEDSHQTSPAYVLTFTRYRNRDTVNYEAESLGTRKPLVVVNDAVSVNVQYSKSNPLPTFSCVLKQGDLNYLTAIHPGDYVVVNMVNWKEKAMEIRERALAGKAINRVNDGFKGFFKILDVRMNLSTAPNGMKQYVVQVTGRGFDEFNNIIYFNPALLDTPDSDQRENYVFLNNFKNFIDLIKKKEGNNVEQLAKEGIKRTIGEGVEKIEDKETGSPSLDELNQIPAFKVPKQIGELLNKKNSTVISQINNYYLGIWKPVTNPNAQNGFSSFFKIDSGNNWFKTGIPLPGTRAISLQDFQNVKVWSLLSDYANNVLNELYTCYRVDKTGKYVYPSVIIRQKPFNTRHYEAFAKKTSSETVKHTKFLDLPRWKIDPELITNLSLGRSDSGRINFVQLFTRSLSLDPNFDQASQISYGNFVADKDDIVRNGRKPFIRNCNYDFAGVDTQNQVIARKWSRLVADWVFGGHLKMNGSIECAGIQDPICVGDNLEFDNIVYHIESISHNIILNAQGFQTFRTSISLSMGVSEASNTTIPVYAEMDYTDAYTRRLDDDKHEGVLPGFSDTQDLPGTSRVKGEEVKETREATFTNPRSGNKGKKRTAKDFDKITKRTFKTHGIPYRDD